MLHINLISSNGVVFVYLDSYQVLSIVSLDQLMGACHTHTYIITILHTYLITVHFHQHISIKSFIILINVFIYFNFVSRSSANLKRLGNIACFMPYWFLSNTVCLSLKIPFLDK